MKLKELMKQYPRTVEADATVGTAARTMLWYGIRHLPVLRDDDLVGIVSERDLAAFQAQHGDAAHREPVTKAMRAEPQTAGPDDSVTEVAARMAEHRIGCLPITERGQLLALVTSTDILAAQVRDRLGSVEPIGATVVDVMTPDPVAVRADDSLVDAAGRMQNMNIRHLPVVDGDRKVIGILSDRDLRSAVGYFMAADEEEAPDRLARLRVGQAMTREVVTVRPQQSLRQLAGAMAGMKVGALPVVDDQARLVGILSVVDILRGLAA
jgi:CBS domain-containing membrane protein